jgi:hypothetical protein
MEQELALLKRKAEKLKKIQDLDEFEPGTVLMFSRSLAGSARKYTFVAFRTWDGPAKWAVTGKPNTLQLLGLKPSGNSWDELLLAIGDAKLKKVSSWKTVGYEYFRGNGSGSFYRVLGEDIEILATDGKWRPMTYWNRCNADWTPVTYDEVRGEVRGEVR